MSNHHSNIYLGKIFFLKMQQQHHYVNKATNGHKPQLEEELTGEMT